MVSQSAYFGLNSDTRTSKRGRRRGKDVKRVRKDNKKARKNTNVLTTTSVTSAATLQLLTNLKLQLMPSSQYHVRILQIHTSQPAEASENLMATTVTPQCGSPQNINTSPSVDLQNCDEVTYEKKDHVHGVSYIDENGSAGWTPVVGRKKKRCRLPEVFLRRFPPEGHLRQANQSDPSDSDQDLDDLIPSHAVVPFSFDELKTWQWTPIAARTRAKLRNS